MNYFILNSCQKIQHHKLLQLYDNFRDLHNFSHYLNNTNNILFVWNVCQFH